MITPEATVGLALEVAREGLSAGEMPIGAVVVVGEEVVASAWAKEQELGRRLVHADLLAMEAADEALGFRRLEQPLTLAVNLEPCLMCLGAAVALGVRRVWYALESPNDGAHALLDLWRPPVELPFFRRPDEVVGGVRRAESVALFREYADGAGPAGMREWARSLCTDGRGRP